MKPRLGDRVWVDKQGAQHMGEAFHQGGWGMYPTSVIGILLVGAAIRFAWQPDRSRLGLIIWMQVLTLLVGGLGFFAGMIKTATHADETTTPTSTLIQGFGESLNNVALAVALVVMAGIAGALGLVRGRRAAARAGGGSSLVDPFTP
jgi:hypothetical protein